MVEMSKKLRDNLNVQDGIRIINDDMGFTVTEMFINDKKVSRAYSGDIVKIKKKINSLGIVVKTTDFLQLKDIGNKIKKTLLCFSLAIYSGIIDFKSFSSLAFFILVSSWE